MGGRSRRMKTYQKEHNAAFKIVLRSKPDGSIWASQELINGINENIISKRAKIENSYNLGYFLRTTKKKYIIEKRRNNYDLLEYKISEVKNAIQK